jgi:hypothetical protein
LRREIDGWRQHSRQENQAQRRDRRGERTRRREAIERRREPAWHHITVKSGGKEYLAYHGNGNGGQLLRVVPQFDLALMITAGNYRQGVWNRERDDIVGEMFIPALGTTGELK